MRYIYLTASIVLLAVIAFILSRDSTTDTSSVENNLSNGLQRELSDLHETVDAIKQQDAAKIWTAGRYLFLFAEGQLAAWSTNAFAPDVSWIDNDGEVKFIKTVRGDFLAVTFQLRPDYVLLGVIPLMERYRITNSYLGPNWNKQVFGEGRPILSVEPIPGSIPVGRDGQILFHASFEDTDGWHSQLSLWLLSAGFLAIMVLLWLEVQQMHRRGKVGLALITLLIGGSAIRVTMIVFGFPARWVATP